MNALQKNAWWTLACTTAACAAVLVAWPYLGYAASGFFGILGLAGFGFLFFRRPGFRAVLDERDRAIAESARDVSMRVAYLFFVLCLSAVLVTFGGAPGIPVKWIGLMAWSGFALAMLANATYTLWNYRKDQGDAVSA